MSPILNTWPTRDLTTQWRIQGKGTEGPIPLFLDQTEERRAEKNNFETGLPFSGSRWTPPLPYLKVWILHCYSSGVLAIRSTFSLMMLMLMGYWCNLVIEFVLTSVFYVKENMGHYFDVISCAILSSLWNPWCYGSLPEVVWRVFSPESTSSSRTAVCSAQVLNLFIYLHCHC